MRDEVFRTVAQCVPYLSALDATSGDDWVSCAALITDPALLATVVRATKAGFETDDDVVAASLFAESYAFRVAGTALVAYALGLPVPDVAPDAVAVKIDKPRPTAVAYLNADVRPTDAHQLARDLVGAHFDPFVTAMHDIFVVGERMLWGNVANACAVALRAVESESGDGVRQRANEFVDASQPWFQEVGSFTTALAGHQGWFWDRTSCCLWFRTASGQYCDNCSLRHQTPTER
jgi:iron complex transport system ATP-binding protein